MLSGAVARGPWTLDPEPDPERTPDRKFHEA
jgi:hypothetical protein